VASGKYPLLLGLILGIWLIGCSSATSVSYSVDLPVVPTQKTPPFLNKQELAENSGQMLPISAQVKFVRGEVIQLEVARTPEEQSLGLMYRKSLPANRGMLFLFSPPRPVSFWMKNTIIPLDMIFLQNGVVKHIASNVPPCTEEPCPTYGQPNLVIDQVIELRGGRAAELGIKVGQKVEINFLAAKPNGSTQ